MADYDISPYTWADVKASVEYTQIKQDAAVMGENTSTGVALDGIGTWIPVTSYSLVGDSGNVSANGTTGEITVNATGIYTINMHCGIVATTPIKDWEFLLGWKVNAVIEQIGSEYISTNKQSTADSGVIITRQLTAGDVVSLQIASLLQSVSVDISNSTLEVLREF